MLTEANGYAMSRRHLTEYLTKRGIRFVRQEHGPAYLHDADDGDADGTPPAHVPTRASTDVPPVLDAMMPTAPKAEAFVTGPAGTGWLTVGDDGTGSATIGDGTWPTAEVAHGGMPCAGTDVRTLSLLASHLRQVADDLDALAASGAGGSCRDAGSVSPHATATTDGTIAAHALS